MKQINNHGNEENFMLIKKKSDPSYLLGQYVAMFQLIEESTQDSGETPFTDENLHRLSEKPASTLVHFHAELTRIEKKAKSAGKSVWLEETNKIYALIPVATLQDTPLNNDEYMKGFFQQKESRQK